MRPANVSDGATDLGKGNLTPGDNQAIPGVTGITILGRVTTRTEYDRNSRPTFTVEDDLDTSRVLYDGAGRVIQTLDAEGNTVESAYDDNGNVIETRQTDVAQMAGVASQVFLSTSFHDSLNRLERQVDNLGQTVYQRYDSRNNLVAQADANGQTTASVNRRVFATNAQQINRFGNVTRHYYDGLSRHVRQEVVLTSDFQGDGIHIGASMEGIKNTLASEDSFPPVPDTTQGGGDGLIRSGSVWDVNSLQSALLDDQGNVTLWIYDNQNRGVTTTKGLTLYLLRGTVTDASSSTLTDTAQSWTTDQWLGRTVAIVSGSAAGQMRVITGNTSNQLMVSPFWAFTPSFGAEYLITPTLSSATLFGPREVVTPTAATINDPFRLSAAHIDTQLNATKFRLDTLYALFPPLSNTVGAPPSTVVTGYDPDGNVLIREDENDTEVFTRLDAVNRAVAVRVFRSEGNPATQPADSHAGDPLFAPAPVRDNRNLNRTFPAVLGTTKENFEYNGLSQLTRATDNNDPATTTDDSTVTEAYDSLGRLLEETQGLTAIAQMVVSSGWRAENLRSSVNYPNNRQIVYLYDRLDRYQRVRDAAFAVNQPFAEYAYIGGRVLERRNLVTNTRMTFVNDAGTLADGYDGNARVVQLRHRRGSDAPFLGFTHGYDRMDNKLSEGKLHNHSMSDNNEVYAYNSAYQLRSFTRPGTGARPPLQSQWTLDGVGNWKQVDGQTRQHSSFNEITQVGTTNLLSDDNGNLTNDGTLAFAFDFRNQLRKVTQIAGSQVVGVYSYDAVGRRARSVTGSGTRDFALDGGEEIEEREGNNVKVQYVFGGRVDEPLVYEKNLDACCAPFDPVNDRLYYHENALGSVAALTNLDALGDVRVKEGYLYDAYGHHQLYTPGPNGVVDWGGDDSVQPRVVSALGNPFLYTARRLDAESLLLYYRARHLDPVLGRFLQRDPSGYGAGDSNLYGYVGSSPTNASDPYGLQERRQVDVHHEFVEKYRSRFTDQDLLWIEWAKRQRGLFLGMHSPESFVAQKYHSRKFFTHVSGAVKTVGGVVETAVGGATGLIGIGGPIAAHGVDTTQAGWRQMLSGEHTRTGTSQGISWGLEKIGVSPRSAYLAGEWTDTGVGIAGPLYSIYKLGQVPEAPLITGFPTRPASGFPIPPANPRQYSIAYETQLNSSVWGRGDKVHFNRANVALDNALKADPEFGRMMEELIPGVGSAVSRTGGRSNPSGWTWHHAISDQAGGRFGVMQLVPTEQHTAGSAWWRILHPDPGAAGGYAEWALPAGAPRRR